MLARQRQAYILDRVREDGGVRVADLVRELAVSDMTIRRDLELLADRGLIEKVHGGATAPAGSALFEPGFTAKSTLQRAEKEAIADAAVGLRRAGHGASGSRPGRRPTRIARRLVDVVGPDRRHQLAPGRRRAPRGRPSRPDDHPDRRRPDAVGRARRAVRRGGPPERPSRPRPPRRPRDGRAAPGSRRRTCIEAETDRALVDAGRRLVVVADHSKWGDRRAQLDRPARRGRRPDHRRSASTRAPRRSSPARSGELIVVHPGVPGRPARRPSTSPVRRPTPDRRSRPWPRWPVVADAPVAPARIAERRLRPVSRPTSWPSRTGATTR